MRRFAAALTLAAAATLSTGAQASPLFDSFQAMCVTPRADDKGAMAVADQAGWMALPADLLKQFSSTEITASDGRMRTDKSGMQFLFAGDGQQNLDGVAIKMEFCAIGVMPGDANLRQEVGAWAGVARDPRMSQGADDIYVYTEAAGVRTQVLRPKDEEAKALLRQRRVNFLFVGEKGGMTLLMFAIPTI